MSVIKSFSVGNGDMFYINHNHSNFTVIDCCLSDENKEDIVEEIKEQKKGKDISRFISTHPDGDHIQRLDYYDDEINIVNFYCVNNEATKKDETNSFNRYCELRDSDKAFFLSEGCGRKWMNRSGPNENGKEIGSAGIFILWPKTSNQYFKEELKKAKDGEAFNNISCIINYRVDNGVDVVWMGDLEKDFMENIKEDVDLNKTNILFAPHHGRKTGKVPNEWIEKLDPDVIIMGESNSKDSDYASYPDHNKIRQNSAGDIIFDCTGKKIHIYVSAPNYEVDFLDNENKNDFPDYNYIGTLNIK